MRFYVVDNTDGTIGCELTLRAAHVVGKDGGQDYSIECVDCPVNAETVRRLLGHLGAFATESDTVYP